MNRAEKIVLRRLKKISLAVKTGPAHPEYVATLSRNLESLGFSFSDAVLERLHGWSPEELLKLAETIVPILLKMVGADVKYQPMYPNFPAQVMSLPEAELYFNAIAHYWGDALGTRILPRYQKQQRPALKLPAKLKPIELAREDEALELCRKLISANTALSPTDQKDLQTLLFTCKDQLEELLPDKIPFKEIQAIVCEFLLKQTENPADLLRRYLRTPTDVLRFATQLSDGDVSLAAPTKYRSFCRPHRRVLLELLDQIKNPVEDLQRHRGKWLRLAERLHPGEYAKRYPNAYQAIQQIRRGERVSTFNHQVEACLAEHDFHGAADLLAQRPGELARRLDHLLRNTKPNSQPILDHFQASAENISTAVLLQLIAHFQYRADDQIPRELSEVDEGDKLNAFSKAIQKISKPWNSQTKATNAMRTVMPKGQVGKLIRVPLADKLISPNDANAVIEIARAALINRFAKLPPLGKCYVAPELERYSIPFSQRSASKSLRAIPRGSRINLPSGNTIRFFIWWKEGKVNGEPTGRVDLDISASIYDSNWKYLTHISYTNLKDSSFNAVHSGDITSAPRGASEFIDIDIEKSVTNGARYVLCSIQSYTTHPFCDLPQCYVGWMSRDSAGSGEVYEPATVQDKIDVSSDRRIAIPMVLDLQERQAVWADLAMTNLPSHLINIESNRRGLVHYGIGITSMVRPNLNELFTLHAKARGVLVDDANEAESVFAVDAGVTPFDLETIAADFLKSDC